jgi:hypothetical protein
LLGVLSSIAALIIGVVGFILGRAISESEKVLAEKRRVYEAFLLACPKPNDAYLNLSEDELKERGERLNTAYTPLLLYCAPPVATAISVYMSNFTDADEELGPQSPALAPVFKILAKSHNDVVLEMRRDALAWSVFGHRGQSRLPKNMPDQLG